MLHSLEEYHNTSIDEISIDQVKGFPAILHWNKEFVNFLY